MGDFYGGVYGRKSRKGVKKGQPAQWRQDDVKLFNLLQKRGFPVSVANKIVLAESDDPAQHNYRGTLKARKNTIKTSGYTAKGTQRKIRKGTIPAGLRAGLQVYKNWRKEYIEQFMGLNEGEKPTREETKKAWAAERAARGMKPRKPKKKTAAGEGSRRRRRAVPYARRRGGVIAGEGFYN